MLHLEGSNCSGTCDDGMAVPKHLVFDVFILIDIAVKSMKHTVKISFSTCHFSLSYNNMEVCSVSIMS